MPMALFSDNEGTGSWGHSLYIDGGKLGFDFTVDDGDIIRISSDSVVTDNKWHHAVVVRGAIMLNYG